MELRIKELLKEKKMLQKDLADKMGVSDVALRQSLKGNPTIGTLQKVADALGVEFVELFAPTPSNRFVCPKCGAVLELVEHKAEE